MLTVTRIGTLFHPCHGGLGLVAHSGADGGIDGNCQGAAITHSIGDAPDMLTLLGLDTVGIQVLDGTEKYVNPTLL